MDITNIGKFFTVKRAGDSWDKHEVACIAIEENAYRCVLSTALCAALTSPLGSKKRNLESRLFSANELTPKEIK